MGWPLHPGEVGAQEAWIAGATGLWSAGVNWADGSAPLPGGNASLVLSFAARGSGAFTATNDLGNPFVLDRLILDATGTGALTLASAAGNSLAFAGAAPELQMLGTGAATVTTPLVLNGSSGLNVTGSATASVTLSGELSETGGAKTLTIATSASAADPGVVVLSGANTFSGGVTLAAGNLLLNSNGALGTGGLTVQGGALRLGAVALGNGVALQSTLLVTNSAGATLGGSLSSAVAGTGLTVRNNTGSLTLTGASTYHGATTLDGSLTPALAASAGGQLILSGGGSLLNSSGFAVNAGSRLRVEAASGGPTNRLADTAPVALRSGEFIFADATGNAVAKSETLGTLSSAGFSTLTFTTGSAAVRLDVAAIERAERGTLLLRGISTGASLASLFSATAPALVGGGGTGSKTSIIPWAIGDASASGAGTGLVTYSAAGGLRLLNSSTEYATSILDPVDNVRLTGTGNVGGTATVNALLLAGGSVAGSGTLTVTSGAILNTTANRHISTGVNFGATEGQIFTAGLLNITGAISGSGGLTKSGAAALNLTGANTFTGLLTVNAGTIQFNAAAALGADASAIVLNGTGAGLTYTGAAPLMLARALETRTGVGQLAVVTAGGDLQQTGVISGAGGLRVTSAAGRKLTLAGSNTYLGPTLLEGGEIVIGSDAAFGSGGDLDFGTGTVLTLTGTWTSGRRLSVSSASTLQTGGFDATLAGVITGAAALTKNDVGALTLLAASPYSGAIAVNAGSLRLAAAGQLRSTTYTLAAGSKLVLDNAAGADSHRLNDNANVTLRSAEMRIEGHATVSVVEEMGILAGTVGSTLTLTAPGSAGTTLRVNAIGPSTSAVTYPKAAPRLLVRGDNLGGGPSGGYTRVLLGTGSGMVNGIVSSAIADDTATGVGSSFATYDASTDAAGVVGLRPLRAAEYATGSTIANPSTGGTTPDAGNFFAGGATTVSGGAATINSLTLSGSAGLALSAGQTLTLASGRVLARAGSSSLLGGTIETGSAIPDFHTIGDLTLGSAVTSSAASLVKRGPGALIVSGAPSLPATLIVHEGPLRVAPGGALAGTTISLEPSGVFDLQTTSTSLGGLLGVGSVALGSGTLTLGTLPANMTFAGAISGAGGLVIVGGGSPQAERTLSGAGTFTGGLSLQSGRLVVGSAAPLGNGPVTFAGGSLRLSTPLTLTNAFVLNQDFILTGGALTLGPGATATGPGAIVNRSSGALTIQALLNAGGGVRSSVGLPGGTATTTGDVTLSDASGGLATAAEIVMGASGVFAVNDTTAFAGGAAGRVPDATPVRLRSATFQLTGNAAALTDEKVGALESAGFSTVTVTPSATVGTLLRASSIARTDRGTFLFRSTGLLGGALGADVGQIKLDAAPADLSAGIVPYAIGRDSAGYGLVTHDANGFRLLAPGEYVDSFAGVTAASNVRLAASVTNNATVTINALHLRSGFTVGGTGTINVAGGTVFHDGTSSKVVGNALNFGTTEGRLFLLGGNGSGLSFPAGLAGSGGLTISGSGLVRIGGGNAVSGPLTLNGSARLTLTSASELGPDASSIVINGDELGAGVQFEEEGMLTIPRGWQVNSGYAAFAVRGGLEDRLVLSGAISGAGGVHVTNAFAIPARLGGGSVVLQGANSYSGPTFLEAPLVIASDAALGNTSAVLIGTSGRLRLEGPWITNRPIAMVSSLEGTIDTNGFDATLNGPLLRLSAGLIKDGAGTLTFSGTPPYTGGLGIARGTFRLAGTGALDGAASVSSGATFEVDNTAQVAPRGSFTVSLTGSEFLVRGNATAATSLSGFTLSAAEALNTVTLIAPGSASVTQAFTTFAPTAGSFTLFRGTQFSGNTGGYTRVTFTAPPALANGLLARALVDETATGGGTSFATYDSTTDSAGVIGIRALRAAEYAVGPTLRNPAEGGTTATTANFLVSGAVAGGGAGTTIHSLTFEPGSSLALEAGQTLSVTTNGLLVRTGASGATLAGGTLATGGSLLHLFGDGDLALGTAITGAGLAKYGSGTLTVAKPVSDSTTLVIAGGRLRGGPGQPLQNGTIQLRAGGTLDVSTGSQRVGLFSGTGSVTLGNHTLSIGRAGSGTVGTFSGSISGSGGLTLSRGTNLTLTAASTYTGPTHVERDTTVAVGGPGALALSGAGSLTAGGIFASGGGWVELDNLDQPADDRLNHAPVTLSGGVLSLRGNGLDSVLENLGLLTVAGAARVIVESDSSAGSAVDTRLTFSSLSRLDRGAIFSQAIPSSSGGTARIVSGMNLSPLLVGDGATSVRRGILPFAAATARFDSTPQLVTYDSGSGFLYPLDTGDYSPALTAGDNVRLSSDTTLNTSVIVNALRLDNRFLSGSGTLGLASGVLLSSGGLSTVAIDLGAVEGHFFSSSSTTLGGTLSGSNGLTLSTLENTNAGFTLAATNNVTGSLTINGGTVRFSSAAHLGGDSSPIVVHDATLSMEGGAPVTLTRAVRTNGSMATFQTNTSRLTLSGAISGPAAVVFDGDIVLNAANSYEGSTRVAKKLTFASDAVFGASPSIFLDETTSLTSPELALAGPWTTARELIVAGDYVPAIIDTAGFDATLNGKLSSSTGYGLTKTGAGNLTVGNAADFKTALSVTGGTLAIRGQVAVGPALAVSAAGTLSGDGEILRAVNVGGTLAPGARIGRLRTGGVTFADGSTFALELDSAVLYDQLEARGTVTLTGTINLSLALLPGFDPVDDVDVFTVLLNDGVDAFAGSGRFSVLGNLLEPGERFFVGSQEFQISYSGGDGNDVVVFAAPEPTTAGLFAGGLAVLGWRRRRR